MSSYNLTSSAESSKVLYINSRDADVYLENNDFGTPLHTNFLYSLTEKINVSADQMALVSLYSATIPHSFFNVRDGVNDTIPLKIDYIDGNGTSHSIQVNIQLDDGNYDTDALISQFYNGNTDFQTSKYVGFKSIELTGKTNMGVDFTTPLINFLVSPDPSTGTNPLIKYNQINNCFRFHIVIDTTKLAIVKQIKITFNFATAPTIGSDATGNTDRLANALFGFNGFVDFPNSADQVEPSTADLWMVKSAQASCFLQSQQVIDLNDNIHGLMLRTNLVSKGTMSSSTAVFSNILARIPITSLETGRASSHGSAQQGGMIYFNPSNATHQNLVDLNAVNVIGVRLTDDKDRTIDLNGLDFQIAILFQFVDKSVSFLPPPNRQEIDAMTQPNIKNNTPSKTSKKK
jgi:hypothetical protein